MQRAIEVDKNITKAFLWENIIGLAFSPKTPHDIDAWLNCYCRTAPSFWGIQEPANRKGSRITLENKYINISYECSIENHFKGAVTITSFSSENNNILWAHDIDPQYFLFPNKLVIPKKINRESDYKTIIEKEMENILDGMIFHPAVHQHIDMHLPELNGEQLISNHDVRIGGGISNIFLFLFHLRYQFCISLEKRKHEKRRLIELFSSNLLNARINISAGELFGVAR